MTIWKRNPCRWKPCALSGLALIHCMACTIVCVRHAHAQMTLTTVELFLEVSVNGIDQGRVIRVEQRGEGWHANAADLRALGLRWPGSQDASGELALADLPGLSLTYDKPAQRLALVAPVTLLDRPLQTLSSQGAARALVDRATLVPGLLLNYDLYGQRAAGQAHVSATTEVRLFGLDPGTWTHSMVSSLSSDDRGPSMTRNVRLDSRWQRDFADEMITLTAGDFATGALPWSRALRLGGVRLASNFQLQPYRITAPLPTITGSAVLPSTVDLFINGMKQSSQQVQPGNFQLSGIPSLSGTGQAQVVITDLNGQRRTMAIDLYGAPQLLQPGLSDWSVEFGHVRKDFGVRSFSYDSRPVANAVLRHGWSAATTFEAHAEATPTLALAGLGGVWLLGKEAGVASASVALSASAAGRGQQAGLSYQWNSRSFTTSVSTLRASAAYRDAASLHDAARLRRTDTAFVGLNAGGVGQWGLSLIRQELRGAQPTLLASLSWSQQLSASATFSASINRDLGNRTAPVFYLSWSMHLDRLLSVGTSAQRGPSGQGLTLNAERSVASDQEGWGWRAQQALGRPEAVQAQVQRQTATTQWSMGATRAWGDSAGPAGTAIYAQANGSLAGMGGRWDAIRRVDNAFALVSTDGVAGVPVRLENRLVGQTDARGQLFVPRLNAHQRNRLSIDTLDLPADMRIDREVIEAVPPSRSGMLAHFQLRRTLAVQFALRDRHGASLPLGTRLRITPAAATAQPPGLPPAIVDGSTVVGYDGAVFLEDPPDAATLQAYPPQGPACRAVLPAIVPRQGVVVLDALICQ